MKMSNLFLELDQIYDDLSSEDPGVFLPATVRLSTLRSKYPEAVEGYRAGRIRGEEYVKEHLPQSV